MPERLAMAAAGGAIAINFETESVIQRLNDPTAGKGPEKCIDAVGMEAHTTAPLEDGAVLYKTFREKENGCIKVVLKP